MRTHVNGNLRVVYPDLYSYCFNPMPLEVYGPAHGQKIAIVAGGITIEGTAFMGCARFDIAQIARSMFSARALSVVDYAAPRGMATSTTRSMEVEVPDAELSFSTLCVWGALQTDFGAIVGGDFNDDYDGDFAVELRRTLIDLVWFYNCPFTVSVPMLAGDSLWFTGNDQVERVFYSALTDGIVQVNPTGVSLELGIAVADLARVTLKNNLGTKRTYRLWKRDDTPALYLRWIDKKGYYCYYGFDKGADSYETKDDGAYIAAFTRQLDYTDGFNGGDGRQQGKVAKRSVEAVASLVDASVWAFLLGVKQSPIVDLYTENDYLGKPRFVKVNVAADKTAAGSEPLSDFVATLTFPEINNQHL